MKMNKFPYVGKNKEGVEALIYSDSSAFLLSGMHSGEMHNLPGTNWFPSRYTNITAEYLSNTKVKIESKEHSELVQNLVFNAGGSWSSGSVQIKNLGAEWHFIDDELLISNSYQRDCDKTNVRLITIPLPPNDKPMELQKEWPAVGDEVLINDLKCNVIGIDGDAYWIKRKKTGTYDIAKRDQLKKPPTPDEEELADILTEITGYQNRQAVLSGAKAIINGEIEGLEYKPQ